MARKTETYRAARRNLLRKQGAVRAWDERCYFGQAPKRQRFWPSVMRRLGKYLPGQRKAA